MSGKSDYFIANPVLKNGKNFNDLYNVIDKYSELSHLTKSSLILDISSFIGLENESMQKRAEHYATVYFDSTCQEVQ